MDELVEGDPLEVARENARRKAAWVAARRPGETVLGADTVVALGDRTFPKPAGEEQAREWLRELSGRTHRVAGGVCVVDPAGARDGVVVTAVTFRELDAEEIEEYVAGGEWRDRAGGYAIQGAGERLVAGIEGSYSNVVGLDEELVARLLADP